LLAQVTFGLLWSGLSADGESALGLGRLQLGWPLVTALLFTSMLSSAFLGEVPHLYHALAFVLIVGGIAVSSSRQLSCSVLGTGNQCCAAKAGIRRLTRMVVQRGMSLKLCSVQCRPCSTPLSFPTVACLGHLWIKMAVSTAASCVGSYVIDSKLGAASKRGHAAGGKVGQSPAGRRPVGCFLPIKK
jgi:hypothetical protein